MTMKPKSSLLNKAYRKSTFKCVSCTCRSQRCAQLCQLCFPFILKLCCSLQPGNVLALKVAHAVLAVVLLEVRKRQPGQRRLVTCRLCQVHKSSRYSRLAQN